MSTEEKVQAIIEYIKTDWKLAKAIMNKNEAVRIQDFASALIYREEEVQLRKQSCEFGESISLLNDEQNPERSVARDSDSSTSDDKQKNRS